MIKAIIFGLGGVVFTDGTKKFKEYLAQKYNLPVDKVIGAIDGPLGTAYREGKVTRDLFWQSLQKQLGIGENADILAKTWIKKYQLVEETKNLIKDLRKKYRIFYLSDNVAERIDVLEKKYHFLPWFEGGIFSHEVGVRKPNLRIYHMIIEKIGIAPEEAVFIDDKVHFLEPARKLGLHVVHCDDPKNLRQKLSNILQ